MKATVVRGILGHAELYKSVMCTDGARRTATLITELDKADVPGSYPNELYLAIEQEYGVIAANSAVEIVVWDNAEGDYVMVWGKLIWNGDSDEADAIFVRFDRDLDVDHSDPLPTRFVWGAAMDLVGPFPEGFQPEGWTGPTVMR